MKNILITGGRGFIGFNALKLWKKSRPELNFFNIDAETYSDKFLIDEKNSWLNENNVPHFTLDLGSSLAPEAIDSIIELFQIDTICHFGAESHVDSSLKSPVKFFNSNILGTINLLESIKGKDIRFHYVSTDEVYGTTFPTDNITEKSPFNPSSPYSSSKASADFIVQSYMKSFDIKASITRSSNNFGPYQSPEKFIPTILKKLGKGEKIPVYGDGQQFRQWIPVDDNNLAILDVMEKEPGSICNVSSNNLGYMKNIDVIRIFSEMYGKTVDESVEFVEDRRAHDISYYILNYKTPEYGETHIKDMFVKTYEWYREHEEKV